MRIINATPHTINYVREDGTLYSIPSEMNIRVGFDETRVGTLDSLTIYTQTELELDVLPEYEEGVYYIVSAIVRTHYPERRDLISPTGYIRDEDGNIRGCTGFIVNEITSDIK